jgi:hypothetical protein
VFKRLEELKIMQERCSIRSAAKQKRTGNTGKLKLVAIPRRQKAVCGQKPVDTAKIERKYQTKSKRKAHYNEVSFTHPNIMIGSKLKSKQKLKKFRNNEIPGWPRDSHRQNV